MKLVTNQSIAVFLCLSALMGLLWIGFAAYYGQPYGYSFKEYQGSDTDVSYYMAGGFSDDPAERIFSRSVPLAFTIGLGGVIGSFLIWFLTFMGTTFSLLFMSGRMLGRQLAFKEGFLLMLTNFVVLFYMVTIGFYSQMLLTLFALLFLCMPERMSKSNALFHGLLGFLMVFSHPQGFGVFLALCFTKQFAGRYPDKVVYLAGAFLFLCSLAVFGFKSSVVFGTVVYLLYIMPKTMLFLGLGRGYNKSGRGGYPRRYFNIQSSWLHWMIVLSVSLAFVDYNARTLFLAFILMIPYAIATCSFMDSRDRKALLACFLIEVVAALIWTVQYYASHFVL